MNLDRLIAALARQPAGDELKPDALTREQKARAWRLLAQQVPTIRALQVHPELAAWITAQLREAEQRVLAEPQMPRVFAYPGVRPGEYLAGKADDVRPFTSRSIGAAALSMAVLNPSRWVRVTRSTSAEATGVTMRRLVDALHRESGDDGLAEALSLQREKGAPGSRLRVANGIVQLRFTPGPRFNVLPFVPRVRSDAWSLAARSCT